MGFTTAVTSLLGTAAVVAGKVVEAQGERKQSKELERAAEERRRIAENQAGVVTHNAMENQRRELRNANMQLASARADAAASNLTSAGSVIVREMDLATRLEDDINNRTNAALHEANTIRTQGEYEARDLEMQSSQARLRSKGAWLGAAGGLFRGLSSVNWNSGSSGSSGSNAERA